MTIINKSLSSIEIAVSGSICEIDIFPVKFGQ